MEKGEGVGRENRREKVKIFSGVSYEEISGRLFRECKPII